MESKVDIAMKQLYKGQDEARFFTVPTSQTEIANGWDATTEIAVVFDGHGDNFFIDQLRAIDLPSHFLKENPAESIQTAVDELQRKLNISYEIALKSGATMSCVTIKKNSNKRIYRIECCWLGDSPIFIYNDGELFFESETHRYCKEGEVERLRKMNILSVQHETISLPNFDILDKDTMVEVKKNYICLRGNYCLEFTRSLGHKRIIGIVPEIHSFDFPIDSSIRIVLCTDGITDMLNTYTIPEDRELLAREPASKIVEYAVERWTKEWNMQTAEETTIERFNQNEIDDCACITWELSNVTVPK